MNCDRALELLALGESSEERELKEHLAACPNCREAAEQLAALQDALQTWEDLPAPDGFSEGVMERITAEQTVVPLFWRPWFRTLAGLAACAVLVVGLYSVSAPREDFQAIDMLRSVGPMSGSTSKRAPLPEPCGEPSPVPYSDGAPVDEDNGIFDACDGTYDREASPVKPAERFSDCAVLILERMPEGAEVFISDEPGAVTVVYNTDTGEEGYQWWTDNVSETLAQIERLAIEQDISAERSSAPAEEALYDLVLLEPAH